MNFFDFGTDIVFRVIDFFWGVLTSIYGVLGFGIGGFIVLAYGIRIAYTSIINSGVSSAFGESSKVESSQKTTSSKTSKK